MIIDKGEKMKIKLLQRQMEKVTLKFWNNMIILSVFMLLLLGSVSAEDTVLVEENSLVSPGGMSAGNLKATLTEETAVKAYNQLSFVEPRGQIESVHSVSTAGQNEYEIKNEIISHLTFT